jgi:hypothetical protein
MAQKPRTTVRKLVTLPLELANEVERFRQETGAASESDALKALIGWGLTRNDKAQDLLERCKRATEGGVTIGDVITSVVADHPLVDRAVVGSRSLDVYLKSDDIDDEHQLRFRFARDGKNWVVERTENHGRDWGVVQFQPNKPAVAKSEARPSSRAGKAELDDDIPF